MYTITKVIHRQLLLSFKSPCPFSQNNNISLIYLTFLLEKLQVEEQINHHEFISTSLSETDSGSNSPSFFIHSTNYSTTKSLHSREDSNCVHDLNRSDEFKKTNALSLGQTVLNSPLVNCCQIFRAGTIYIPASANVPSRSEVISTMLRYNIDSIDNRSPFWSKTADHVRLNELKGKIPVIRSRLVSSLPDFGQELPNCSKISTEELIRVNDIKDPKHKSLLTI